MKTAKKQSSSNNHKSNFVLLCYLNNIQDQTYGIITYFLIDDKKPNIFCQWTCVLMYGVSYM